MPLPPTKSTAPVPCFPTARVDGLSADHSVQHLAARQADAAGGRSPTQAGTLAQLPEVTHPAAPVHPATGARALLLGSMAIPSAEGLPKADGQMLLADLLAHTTGPDYLYTRRWKQGDLVVWDNLACPAHHLPLRQLPSPAAAGARCRPPAGTPPGSPRRGKHRRIARLRIEPALGWSNEFPSAREGAGIEPGPHRPVGREMQAACPGSDASSFTAQVTADLTRLELKARIARTAEGLHQHLPVTGPPAPDALLRSLPATPEAAGAETDFGLYIYAPHSAYVAAHHLHADHLDQAFAALAALTPYFSAEEAVRTFLNTYPQQILAAVATWAAASDHRVRRLADEALRPHLPWSVGTSLPVDTASRTRQRWGRDLPKASVGSCGLQPHGHETAS